MFFRNYHSSDNKSGVSINATADSFTVALFPSFRADGRDTPPAMTLELNDGRFFITVCVDGESIRLDPARTIEVLTFLQMHPLRPLRDSLPPHHEHSPSLAHETLPPPQRTPTEPVAIA